MTSEGKNGKLQVVIKSYTSIEKSKTEFDIPDSANDGSTTTTLGSLSVFESYDRVNIDVAFFKVKNVEIVGENQMQKQEVVVADETGRAVLVLWGDRIG